MPRAVGILAFMPILPDLAPGWYPPSREHWELVTYTWQFFPVVGSPPSTVHRPPSTPHLPIPPTQQPTNPKPANATCGAAAA